MTFDKVMVHDDWIGFTKEDVMGTDDIIDGVYLNALELQSGIPIDKIQGIELGLRTVTVPVPMTFPPCCDGEKFLDEFELLPEAIRNKILILMRLGKQ